MKKNIGKNLILAIVCSTAIMAVVVGGFLVIENHIIKRVCEMFGGHLPFGFIQYVTYIAFFWAMFEVRDRLSHIKHEEQGLRMKLLPEQEQWVITPNDVNDLKLRMIDLSKQHSYQVIDVIKKASTKFRSNRSVAEVMDIVSNQVKLYTAKAESRQSNIRYLAWLIPSLGFIGTVVGIAASLGLADKAQDPEVMSQITNAMEVAFDTTLVSLLLSIPVMWYYHHLQEKEETFYINMEEYVMENFVNRINLE